MDTLKEMAKFRYEIFEKQEVEETSFDITFKFADEQILKTHKFILTSLSDTFKAMFTENWNKTGIMDIKFNTYDEFKALLKFCYLGYSAVSDENVDLLLELSHCYNIPLLTKAAIHFVDVNKIISNENVVVYFNIAQGYDFNELLEIIRNFLKDVTSRFLSTDSFLNAKKEFVLYLLGLDRVAIEESDLFKAVIEWGTRKYCEKCLDDDDELKEGLEDILPLIRFPTMSLDFLLNDVVKHGYLFSYEDLSNILQDALDLSRNKRLENPRSAYSCVSRIEKYIEITDANLKKISAPFLYFDERLINDIKKTTDASVRLSNGSYWKSVKLEKPKRIPMNCGTEFSYFLVIDKDADLSVKDTRDSEDYVIAQFKKIPGFSCGEGCRIKCVQK